MKHKERIRRLAIWLSKTRTKRPFFAFCNSASAALPDTLPENIEAAQAAGRPVFHIRFVKRNGDKFVGGSGE